MFIVDVLADQVGVPTVPPETPTVAQKTTRRLTGTSQAPFLATEGSTNR